MNMNSNMLKYINENHILTKCEKDMIINSLKNKYSIYVNAIDHYQLYYYYQTACKGGIDKYVIHYLEDSLLHFTNLNVISKIFKKLAGKKKISDIDIIHMIQKSDGPYKHYKECDKWDFVFEKLANEFTGSGICAPGSQLAYAYELTDSCTLANTASGIFNYLDVGCGFGTKSVKFGHAMNLDYKSIYGCDIQKWGPYESAKKKPLQFSLIGNRSNKTKLPYKNNFFQVVSSIFTLHHVNSLQPFLKEIYRVVKPGGFFIIIEHDSYNDYDKMLLDIEHKMYGVIYDKREDYCDKPDFMETYNRFEWRFLLEQVGFKYVRDDVLYFNTEREIRYDKPFFSIFAK